MRSRGSQRVILKRESIFITTEFSIKYRKDVVSLVILTDDNKNFKPNKYEKKRWGFELTLKFPSIKILDYKR